MKRSMLIVGIVLLVAALAVPVLAHGPGGGKRDYGKGHWGGGPGYCWDYGRGYDNLTDEQRSQLDNLYQKFYDETASIRIQIWAKRGELNVLMNTSDPDPEKARALVNEISHLRAKLAQERLNLELEARKIGPEGYCGSGYGMGYGHHMRWHGPGMGYGRHMGGYGPGSCWN